MEINKENQIDEMAKLICTYPQCIHYSIIGECAYADCQIGDIAEGLYKNGYRKASDVALKVIKEVEQILTVKIIGIEEDLFHGTAAHWDGTRRNCYEELLVELAELKKKYTEGEG